MNRPPATARMTPIVLALALTQIIGYGTLYYSFGILAPHMATSFGLTEEWLFAALSASLLVCGLVSPFAGRLADRFGAARMMTAGSLVAALALAFCAAAPEAISFSAGLLVGEIATCFIFYAMAFTVLVQAGGSSAQRSITHLTLIAGFASTMFWPLIGYLQHQLDWRQIYWGFAALNLLVCVPVHALLARHVRRAGPTMQQALPEAAAPAMVRPEEAKRVFILLVLSFALLSFVMSAILVHMVPMLGDLGLGGAGVWATALFGPAQVASRLLNLQFGRGLSQPMLGAISAAAMPAGLLVLALTAPLPAGAAVFAMLFGIGTGLSSIVSGTLPLVLFGAEGYGRRQGSLGSARLAVSALAPFAFSVLATMVGARPALWLFIAAGAASTLAFLSIWWMFRPRASSTRS
jgi:MFS family permease